MQNGMAIEQGQVMLSRGRKHIGVVTGVEKRCSLEGCRGMRIGVRWFPKGNITWPCTKGIRNVDTGKWKHSWEIM